MLGLARKSTVDELEDEINELECKLQNTRTDRNRARRKRRETSQRLVEAETAHKAALDAGEFDGLENKGLAQVEELEEPRIAYKKGRSYIIELVIPAGEKVVHPTRANKKRTSKAYVREFYHTRTGEKVEHENYDRSLHDRHFTYAKGMFVEPTNPLNESVYAICTDGIHCFATREEAENY